MSRLSFFCCGFCLVLIGRVYADTPISLENNGVIAMPEQPKRRGPKPVPPVEINKVRYEVLRGAKARGFGQDGGVLAAVDIVNGKELWTITVYKTAYDRNEEQDVQEVYITKLILNQDKSMLRVENEAHKFYLVNLTTREVSEITGK
jgi:hypothetical protein